jgi:(E)-4-hydroxy-3-methylbut-2-enyl-diphosphate synthase
MEFIRICEKNAFYNLVISMKASNALVMVQAYRLLAATMLKNGRSYPLHLGVTEAGDGEDGRIKSAVGIGALLEDGLGDTIRVSLTEEPEKEIPVAAKLAQKFENLSNLKKIDVNKSLLPYSPFSYERRSTAQVANIGSKNVPVVVADLSDKQEIKPSNFYSLGYNYSIELDKWTLQEQAADYVFIGDNLINFEKPGSLGLICNYDNWKNNYSTKPGCYPLVHSNQLNRIESAVQTFVLIDDESTDDVYLNPQPNYIYVLQTNYSNRVAVFREQVVKLTQSIVNQPIILNINSSTTDQEQFQINVSSEAGALLIDGLGDGLWICGTAPKTLINSTAFGILQATRTRISKTEYISCPSCGRTLFDLQETTAKIRKETAHLKGLKIGIMGCIVNGPGEMADADYGYVGTGPGKITLYKEKTVVKKNVQEDEAVRELINLIKENGDWVDQK